MMSYDKFNLKNKKNDSDNYFNAFIRSTPINTSKSSFTNFIIFVEVICGLKKLLECIDFPWIIYVLFHTKKKKKIKEGKKKKVRFDSQTHQIIRILLRLYQKHQIHVEWFL